MKVNFNRSQVTNIIANTRFYKRLFVTTRGVMYRTIETAENAVRTLNAAIDDPADYIGVAELTSGDFSDEAVREMGRDVEKFNELFKRAIVPRARKKWSVREEVQKDNACADVADVDTLLNGGATATEPTETTETEKPETTETTETEKPETTTTTSKK